ncbi:MAG: hypothetical protein EBZ53_07815 [Verrucomicrobia bacterium]|nr:hypothetical protein [Verrucomicrobiota bacterium]
MEVVGRAEAFLVAEEFEEVGVKLGGGADEVAEGGLDDGAEGFGGEIEGGEPAADGEADAEGGVQLGGDAVEGGGLLTDEAAELGQGRRRLSPLSSGMRTRLALFSLSSRKPEKMPWGVCLRSNFQSRVWKTRTRASRAVEGVVCMGGIIARPVGQKRSGS